MHTVARQFQLSREVDLMCMLICRPNSLFPADPCERCALRLSAQHKAVSEVKVGLRVSHRVGK